MLLSALEKLEGGAAPQNVDDLDEAMLTVMEAEKEIADEVDAVEEMDEVVEEAEEALTRLEGIRDAITEYGISKPMMLAADPNRELVAGGVIGDYEDLDTVPVKDSDASAAIESIGETIKNVWKKLADFFKNLWTKIKNLFAALTRGFKSQETIVVNLIKQYKDANLDEKKFKEITVNAIPKKRLEELAKNFDNSMGKLEELGKLGLSLVNLIDGEKTDVDKVEKDVAKFISELKSQQNALKSLGIDIKVDEKTKSIVVTTKDVKLEKEKKKMNALGWGSTSDIEKGLKASYVVITAGKVADKTGEVINKTLSAFSKKLEGEIKHVADMDPAEVRSIQKVVNQVKGVINAARKISQHVMMSGSTIASSMSTVGKAGLKAKAD